MVGALVIAAAAVAGLAWLARRIAFSETARRGIDLQTYADVAAQNLGSTVYWLAAALIAVAVCGHFAGRASAWDRFSEFLIDLDGDQAVELDELRAELDELRQEAGR